MKNKNNYQRWIRRDKDGIPDRIVKVRVTGGTYTSEEIKQMILESGIPEEEWIKWKERNSSI